jgi:hypothetical protein
LKLSEVHSSRVIYQVNIYQLNIYQLNMVPSSLRFTGRYARS